MFSLGGEISKKLRSPALWIDILVNADKYEPSCRLDIAQNIGPLVRCMCNDTERLFFNSNKHWREGIVSFVKLIHGMIHKDLDERGKKEVIEALLNHEGVMCWLASPAYCILTSTWS